MSANSFTTDAIRNVVFLGHGGTGTVVLRTTERDGWAIVTVSDDGIGIPADHVDRIFDPFFTTKKVGAGIGLGLSTSYGIVQRHGGTLEAESVLGEGTTFRVLLPLEPAAVTELADDDTGKDIRDLARIVQRSPAPRSSAER